MFSFYTALKTQKTFGFLVHSWVENGSNGQNRLKFAQILMIQNGPAEPNLQWTDVTGRFVVDSKY